MAERTGGWRRGEEEDADQAGANDGHARHARVGHRRLRTPPHHGRRVGLRAQPRRRVRLRRFRFDPLQPERPLAVAALPGAVCPGRHHARGPAAGQPDVRGELRAGAGRPGHRLQCECLGLSRIQRRHPPRGGAGALRGRSANAPVRAASRDVHRLCGRRRAVGRASLGSAPVEYRGGHLPRAARRVADGAVRAARAVPGHNRGSRCRRHEGSVLVAQAAAPADRRFGARLHPRPGEQGVRGGRSPRHRRVGLLVPWRRATRLAREGLGTSLAVVRRGWLAPASSCSSPFPAPARVPLASGWKDGRRGRTCSRRPACWSTTCASQSGPRRWFSTPIGRWRARSPTSRGPSPPLPRCSR